MSSKSAQSAHMAGIFADMSLDGPEIGTLVAVIDRARNLPNRKTMGKQDPYCAMRLGKEAKKTETDRRGGQTPKWDQEIRFTVHESPDYYKLKCSVFNDDKKTDLIGESWVDLKEVVVPGGGQNDLWHQLQFKGKYAGEIRMELTYYDTRPKDETVLEKRREKTRNNSQSTPTGSEVGGLKQLGPRDIKRRPLPPSPASSSPSQNPVREPALPTQQPPQTYEQAVVPRRQLPMAHFEANGSNHSSLQYQQVQHYPEPHRQPHDHSYDDLQPYEEPAPNHEYTQSSGSGYLPFDGPPGHSQYIPQPVRQPWEEEEGQCHLNPVHLPRDGQVRAAYQQVSSPRIPEQLRTSTDTAHLQSRTFPSETVLYASRSATTRLRTNLTMLWKRRSYVHLRLLRIAKVQLRAFP